MSIPMREILDKVSKRRTIKVRPGQSYNLEKQVEPGLPVDLDANLSSMDTLEFCLVREHSISGEKVEIDPVVTKSGTRFFRQRAVTYDADSIASCDMLEEKDGGKSVFRLTYFGHDYKHHDFEADIEMCNEIVYKMDNILELRLSPVRKDYVAHRDKNYRKNVNLFYKSYDRKHRIRK